jgi:FtsP/CotA-like multicopper oxidase with cupredoxin domain
VVSRVDGGPGGVWINGSTVLNGSNRIMPAAGQYRELFGAAALETQTLILTQNMAPATIVMRPNQFQLWHIVNTVPGMSFDFATSPNGVQWRQTAYDDLPLVWENFSAASNLNAAFTLGPANRVDLLVQAPARKGVHALSVAGDMLTIQVQGNDDGWRPAAGMTAFPTAPALYPQTPAAMKDIASSEIGLSRKITFASATPGVSLGADQPLIQLAAAEQWQVSNTTSAPRTLHLDNLPFQVTEIFDPATMSAPRILAPPWKWADTIQIPASTANVSVPGYVTLQLRGGRRMGPAPYAYRIALFHSVPMVSSAAGRFRSTQ